MNIKFDDKLPIYIQIMDLIKIDIIKGNLRSGDKIPSVRELSSKLKVNPNTIQRAYSELEREGITVTQRGMGSFIMESEEMSEKLRKEMAKEVVEAFVMRMTNLGFNKDEIANIISEEMKGE